MDSSQIIISPFQYNPGYSSDVVTYLEGIKGGREEGTYLLVGANNSTGPDPVGLMYQGPLDAVQSNGVSGSGVWTIISAPQDFDAAGTSVYGPDLLAGDDRVNYVGAFNRDLDDLTPRALWQVVEMQHRPVGKPRGARGRESAGRRQWHGGRQRLERAEHRKIVA